MREKRQNLKISGNKPNVNDNTYDPKISFGGKWLESFGYHFGDKIDIHCTEEKIVITKSKD